VQARTAFTFTQNAIDAEALRPWLEQRWLVMGARHHLLENPR
jgi:hypothetical protein